MVGSMNQEDKKLFKLRDIDVHSVGLVTMGANREKFFLMKSQEDQSMPTQDQVPAEALDETTDELPEGVAEKVTKIVNDALTKLGINKDADADVEEEIVEDEPGVEDVAGDGDAETEVAKGEDAILVKVDKLVDANRQLTDRLVKAENALNQERESRTRQEFIAKAQVFKSLPEAPSELGEKLMKLYGHDEKLGDYFYTLLKSLDEQLEKAGIFSEYGSSEVDESSLSDLEKAARDGDPDKVLEAIDKMNAKEAQAYLDERRKAIRGG